MIDLKMLKIFEKTKFSLIFIYTTFQAVEIRFVLLVRFLSWHHPKLISIRLTGSINSQRYDPLDARWKPNGFELGLEIFGRSRGTASCIRDGDQVVLAHQPNSHFVEVEHGGLLLLSRFSLQSLQGGLEHHTNIGTIHL